MSCKSFSYGVTCSLAITPRPKDIIFPPFVLASYSVIVTSYGSSANHILLSCTSRQSWISHLHSGPTPGLPNPVVSLPHQQRFYLPSSPRRLKSLPLLQSNPPLPPLLRSHLLRRLNLHPRHPPVRVNNLLLNHLLKHPRHRSLRPPRNLNLPLYRNNLHHRPPNPYPAQLHLQVRLPRLKQKLLHLQHPREHTHSLQFNHD